MFTCFNCVKYFAPKPPALGVQHLPREQCLEKDSVLPPSGEGRVLIGRWNIGKNIWEIMGAFDFQPLLHLHVHCYGPPESRR